MRIKKRTSKRAELSEENVKRVINIFEDASLASFHKQNEQYSAQPMLNGDGGCRNYSSEGARL